MKTNLFIVGAAKCATTSFHDYLNQHPAVCMSHLKEPNYFSNEEIKKDNLYYLKANLIDSLSEYEKLFDKKNQYSIYGESSVSYLSYTETAAKIKKYNPEAKILIFLRNPVERTYSHYLMDYTAGYFDVKLEEIIKNKNISPVIYNQIIGLSHFHSQIKNYFDMFDSKQIKIVIYEDFVENLESSMESIEEFLSIAKYDKYIFTKENSYRGSKNKFINLFYRSVKLKSKMKFFLPKKITKKLKKSLLNSEKPTLSIIDKEQLQKMFFEDIRKLELLLNIDLSQKWF